MILGAVLSPALVGVPLMFYGLHLLDHGEGVWVCRNCKRSSPRLLSVAERLGYSGWLLVVAILLAWTSSHSPRTPKKPLDGRPPSRRSIREQSVQRMPEAPPRDSVEGTSQPSSEGTTISWQETSTHRIKIKFENGVEVGRWKFQKKVTDVRGEVLEGPP